MSAAYVAKVLQMLNVLPTDVQAKGVEKISHNMDHSRRSELPPPSPYRLLVRSDPMSCATTIRSQFSVLYYTLIKYFRTLLVRKHVVRDLSLPSAQSRHPLIISQTVYTSPASPVTQAAVHRLDVMETQHAPPASMTPLMHQRQTCCCSKL